MNALVTRRSLLWTGAALGAAAAVGGGLAYLRAAAPGFRVLAPGEVEIVEAIARVLFPPGPFPIHGGDGGTAPMVDTLLADVLDPATIVPFRYLLRAIQVGTVVARGRTFVSLDPDEAAEVLAIWASEDPFPRRIASESFKAVLGMAFLRRPEVVAAVGWKADCRTGPA